MSAPVVNQAYSQQVNQAFDLFKTFTPQQMQQMGQQVAQKPNSPEAVAFAGAAQYQKQMKAPPPQAPQGTIFQQRLQEFQQTSPQGLPSVGGNQMAMQQSAQQDPMRNAGIGAAPENMPAPQDPMQAATGGLVALAHGGEVRRFEEGGYFGSFNDYGEEYQKQLQGLIPPPSREEAYGTVLEEDKLKLDKDLAEKKSKEHTGDIGQQIDLTDREQPPIISMPTDKAKDKITDHQGMAGLKKNLSKGEVNPSSYDADAAVATMLNSQTTPKYSEAPIGKDDVVHEKNPNSSAARNEAAPTAYQTLEDIMKFRGEEADMSEEVAMAKEAARGANKDKWGTALAQGIGGMLSAQTPYMGQALGAGLLSGVSGYQSGAKDEQAATKDLMALQMANKKAGLQGHREAADIILAKQTAIDAARASTYNKMMEEQYKQGLTHKNAVDIKDMEFDNARAQTILKSLLESKPTAHQDETLYMKAVDIIKTNSLFEKLTDAEIMEKAQAYVDSAKGQQGEGDPSTAQPFKSLSNGMRILPQQK
jgi:hypothetical protein